MSCIYGGDSRMCQYLILITCQKHLTMLTKLKIGLNLKKFIILAILKLFLIYFWISEREFVILLLC